MTTMDDIKRIMNEDRKSTEIKPDSVVGRMMQNEIGLVDKEYLTTYKRSQWYGHAPETVDVALYIYTYYSGERHLVGITIDGEDRHRLLRPQVMNHWRVLGKNIVSQSWIEADRAMINWIHSVQKWKKDMAEQQPIVVASTDFNSVEAAKYEIFDSHEAHRAYAVKGGGGHAVFIMGDETVKLRNKIEEIIATMGDVS